MAYKRDYDEYDTGDFDEDDVYYDDAPRHATRQKSRLNTQAQPRPARQKKTRRRQPALGKSAFVVLLVMVFSFGLCLGRLALPKQEQGTQPEQSDAAVTPSSGEKDNGSTLTEEEKLAAIQSDTAKYPQAMRELVEKNPETLDYVYDYPINSTLKPEINLSAEAGGSTVPLLLQWDERWGYNSYGSGLIGYTGCGPTCLSMVALYLTRDADYDPATVARYAEQQGYYVDGSGTAWELMTTGCAHFGLTSREVGLDEEHMAQALSDGEVLICSVGPGDFTDGGHYIVLTGHSANGFTICDPNSPKRSAETWTYTRLKDQIRNVWAFSKA